MVETLKGQSTSTPPPARGGTPVPPRDRDWVLTALARAGLDASVMNVQVLNGRLVVSAKRWIDEGWDEYDAALKAMGFRWVPAGKQSRWEGG